MLFLKEIFRKSKRTLENQRYNKRNNRRFRRKTGEKRKLKDHTFIIFTSSRQEKKIEEKQKEYFQELKYISFQIKRVPECSAQ